MICSQDLSGIEAGSAMTLKVAAILERSGKYTAYEGGEIVGIYLASA